LIWTVIENETVNGLRAEIEAAPVTTPSKRKVRELVWSINATAAQVRAPSPAMSEIRTYAAKALALLDQGSNES
jgi:hypothetical protein